MHACICTTCMHAMSIGSPRTGVIHSVSHPVVLGMESARVMSPLNPRASAPVLSFLYVCLFLCCLNSSSYPLCLLFYLYLAPFSFVMSYF